MRALIAALALAGACRPTPAAPAAPSAPAAPHRDELVGQLAPAFASPAVGSAGSVALADLAGHVVVVDFWASWCAPCAAAVPYLDAWQHAYAARGLRVVGISSDDDDGDIARYAAAHQIAFAVARDDGDKIATAYRVAALPTLVVIDKQGVVRYVDVGGRDFAALEAAVVRLLQ